MAWGAALGVSERAEGRSMDGTVMGVLHEGHDAFAAAYTGRHPGSSSEALTQAFREGSGPVKLAGVDFLVATTQSHLQPLVLEVNTAPGYGYCTPGQDAQSQAYDRTAELVISWMDPDDPDGVAVLAERAVAGETRAHHRAIERRLGRTVRLLGKNHLATAVVDREGGHSRLTVCGRPISGGLRHLHTEPWRLVPPGTTGGLVNGTEADLQGGRDKVAAACAYSALEKAHAPAGIVLPRPRTWVVNDHRSLDTALRELDRQFAVLKVPDANSGLGVTFCDATAARQRPPFRFPLVVQEVVGPAGVLPSTTGPLHAARVGGLPYAFDLRVIIGYYPSGLAPIMVFARRARDPLSSGPGPNGTAPTSNRLDAMLKTNLLGGTRRAPGFDEDRVLMPDPEGWSALGLSADDLRYTIAVAMLATIAVGRFGTPRLGSEDRHDAP